MDAVARRIVGERHEGGRGERIDDGDKSSRNPSPRRFARWSVESEKGETEA